MAARYVAGASRSSVRRAARLRRHRPHGAHAPSIAPIQCPFTGETLTAVLALDLDVAVIHAQQADRQGNVQLWGIVGVQKEAVLAARRSIVTVEEIVDELEPGPTRGAAIVGGDGGLPGAGRARTRASRWGTPSATTTSTARGTRSPTIATRSSSGSTATFAARPTSTSTAAAPTNRQGAGRV